MSLKSDCR